MRSKIVAGNWKLNGSRAFATALLNTLLPGLKPNVTTLIIPPLPYLDSLISTYVAKGFSFGAQDVGVHTQGAFTGDISAEMLADISCQYVLVGHSGANAFDKAIIAYEPIWAIGTGKTASPEQVQEVHAFIRSEVAAIDAKIAGSLPILYGGSVKASNAVELFSLPDVDGGLVGGASLIAQEFTAIVAAAAG